MTREEKNHKEREYRARNKEYFRLYYASRYKEKQHKRRLKRYAGKRCGACDILLSSDYGGHGTKKYCDQHKGMAHKIYMQKWREAKKKGTEIKKDIAIIPKSLCIQRQKTRQNAAKMPEKHVFLDGKFLGSHLIRNGYCNSCDTVKEYCIFSQKDVVMV